MTPFLSPLVLLSMVLLVGGVSLIIWQLYRQQLALYHSMALQGTAIQVDSIKAFRQFYSTEVAARAKALGIEVVHDYEGKAHALPLPATLTIKLGAAINQARPGAWVRLYSDYPFPWRKETGGIRDAFGAEALRQLRQHPDQPFYRFEEYQGRPSLRYAVADRMQASCVACHNSHPDSPKTDWKEGDVRGVLEFIRPLDNHGAVAVVRSRADLWRIFGGTAPMFGVGLAGLGLAVRSKQRASESLRQSEERFRMLSSSAPIGIFETDTGGAKLYSNPQWEKITGLAPADTADQGWARVIHPADAAEVFAGWRAAAGQGLEFNGEFRLLTTNGEVRWVHLRSAPMRSEAGGLIGHVGTVEDISERKRVQETLSQQARLATLGADIGVALTRQTELREILHYCAESIVRHLDAAFARIWTLNDRDNVLELQASAALYTHLDGPHSRVPVGKFKIGLIAQERKPHLTNSVVGDPRVGDQEWAKREGMVAFAGYPLLVGDQVVGVMAMFSRQPLADSTLQALASIADGIALGVVRKQVEQALRAGEARIRLIVDTSLDAIVTIDAQSVVLEWNPQAEKTFGWSQAEAVGRNLTGTIIPPRYREAHLQGLKRYLATGQGPVLNKRIEIEALHKDGREFPVELAISPLRFGESFLFSACLRDITERKQAEAQLDKAHRELLEASRLAGRAEVATGVLHNVGNVLNSVNVSAILIADQVRKSKSGNLGKLAALLHEHAADLGAFLTTDPKGKQLPGYVGQLSDHLAGEQQTLLQEVEALRKNVEHIKEIVAMQQNYAKVSGVAEIVKLSELVEDALRMNAGALDRHEVQAIREFEDVPPITVDRHKVFQILINLLGNAKYACDESARRDKQITIRVANGDGRVRIVVSDNGIGIPAENLTRIFAHGFTTRKDGHGFGLHSGALAAKEMGGSLVAHSDGPGKGATFTLELPPQLPGKFDA